MSQSQNPFVRLKFLIPLEWKRYEVIWLLFFIGTALTQCLLSDASWFTFTVFCSGACCVLLVAKGHISNYIVGIYNCCAYAWVAQQNGLYGEMGLNLFFFLPMAFVGIFLWRWHLSEKRVRMRALGPRARGLIFLGLCAATAGLGYALSLIPGQNSPYIDAATNVLSVAATLLMALRYREQWHLYITLNILSIVMWGLRLAAGSNDGLLMLLMWFAYLTNAVYGWYNWRAGSRADAQGSVQPC